MHCLMGSARLSLEERRQWRRERELIQTQAQKMIADLRATVAELTNEPKSGS